MPRVSLDARKITDWTSFHSLSKEVFGFPTFYGKNLDAWIDCMSYLDDKDARMVKIYLRPNEKLTIEISNSDDFRKRLPHIFSAIIDAIASVNNRYDRRTFIEVELN